jgi:Domain of unknown function (DUF4160)
VPTITRQGAVALKIFFSDTVKHKAPHVHVYVGGDSVAVVSLLTRRPFIGGPLSRKARKLIDDNFEDLLQAWDECNG